MTAPLRADAYEIPASEIARHFARLCACGRPVESWTTVEIDAAFAADADVRPSGVCRVCWSEEDAGR